MSHSEKQVREISERQNRLEEEIKMLKNKISELEAAKLKMELELKEKIEESKLNVS